MEEKLTNLIENEKWDEAYELVANIIKLSEDEVDYSNQTKSKSPSEPLNELSGKSPSESLCTGIENDVQAILCATVLLHEGKRAAAIKVISEGLKYNSKNYELFLCLADYYSSENSNQAYLCYEMAALYGKYSADAELLSEMCNVYRTENDISANPFSVAMVSYNSIDMTKSCIQTLRNNIPNDNCQIIVVDNASSDGVVQWLETQSDIILIKNSENKGFGYASNQGAEMAAKANDIFFLNNDTLIPDNAIFWLRMGLYSGEKVGAVGSVSNSAANGQTVSEKFSSLEEWWAYAKRRNVPMVNAYEQKIWLTGFALFVKRNVLDEIGLFDLRFGLGNYEDNDLGVRILTAGYKLYVCHNSFIYHFGGAGFKQNKNAQSAYLELCRKNQLIFKDKWNFDILHYSRVRHDVVNMIEAPVNQSISVLEVGCGAGALLGTIKYRWPNAEIKGIERNSVAAQMGNYYYDICCGNVEDADFEMPYEKGEFDYIIFADEFERIYDANKVINRLRPFLKENGAIIACVSNFMHFSVLTNLVEGRLDAEEDSILDRKNIRFYTLENIKQLFENCGMGIEMLHSVKSSFEPTERQQRMLDELGKFVDERTRHQYMIYQYLVLARGN